MAEPTDIKKKAEQKINPIVDRPHGQEQQIKMDILSMIERAENPFDIIYHFVKWLEVFSGEPGYAKYAEDQIRSVYGLALQHVKPMQNELAEVEARLKRIEAAYEKPEFTEEERTRIGFAITHHKENIERLKILIKQAKANHSSMKLQKD
ncbi:hypothetical protein [Mitsuokella sp. WILCCON 0060]|uniref:hypothetical protein n=1 Tax=unclassified Mitsuokella TaxID=2637239 RepID=UPI003F024ACC